MSKIDWSSWHTWAWPLTILVVAVVAILIVNILIRVILARLRGHLSTRYGTLVVESLRALSLPLRVAVWVVGLSIAADMIAESLLNRPVTLGTRALRDAAIVVALIWFVLRWKNSVIAKLHAQAEKGKPSFTLAQLELIGKFVTLVTLLFGGLVFLRVVGIEAQLLVAIGGFGTLAVGLAGKDVFANFFSGFMLYITHPFEAGDRVRSPDRVFEGKVEEVGWYLTRIQGDDGYPIYVPNSLFSTSILVNATRT